MTELTLPNFTKARVLVVGDLMLDRYWYGDTSRVSPEAPVPVVRVTNMNDKPGGASNVALNLSALGVKATLIGTVGKDAEATTLQKLLQQAGVVCHFHADAKVPTITKLRVLAQHQQLLRVDFEEPNVADVDILSLYKRQLLQTDLVVISDYGKGVAKQVPELIKLARELDIPILVDPKGSDFSIYNGATAITPNFSEFTAVVGECETDADIEIEAFNLIKKHKLDAILVTRGAQGMSLMRPDIEPLHVPTKARDVYDVTGAGDTVIATLAAVLATGVDFATATMLANTAAGIVVQKLGAETASVAELRRAQRQQQDSWLGVVNEQRLLEEVADAKAHGETVVMTNGCFDILHAGHIAYLEQAKSLGTRLVVAVNDDASVKRLKGADGRPINHLEQRMAVLAGLRCVDWVVSFSADTPLRIIKAVTPDILVKGGDWAIEEIIGYEYMLKNGGKVMSLPYVDNQSTTNIVNRIRES